MRLLSTLLLVASGVLCVFAQDTQNAGASQDLKPADVKPMRVKMGPPIVASNLLVYSRPPYPQEAKDKNVQGIVRVHLIIGTDGKVIEANAISGDSLLAQSAIEAIRKWTYRPTLLNGQPVEVDSEVVVTYKLGKKPKKSSSLEKGSRSP